METRYTYKYKGNFARLTYPYDPDAKACGIDLPKHPYIYFAAPSADVFITSYRPYGSPPVFLNAPKTTISELAAIPTLSFTIAHNMTLDNK